MGTVTRILLQRANGGYVEAQELQLFHSGTTYPVGLHQMGMAGWPGWAGLLTGWGILSDTAESLM